MFPHNFLFERACRVFHSRDTYPRKLPRESYHTTYKQSEHDTFLRDDVVPK